MRARRLCTWPQGGRGGDRGAAGDGAPGSARLPCLSLGGAAQCAVSDAAWFGRRWAPSQHVVAAPPIRPPPQTTHAVPGAGEEGVRRALGDRPLGCALLSGGSGRGRGWSRSLPLGSRGKGVQCQQHPPVSPHLELHLQPTTLGSFLRAALLSAAATPWACHWAAHQQSTVDRCPALLPPQTIAHTWRRPVALFCSVVCVCVAPSESLMLQSS
jgi:hypothetical protein